MIWRILLALLKPLLDRFGWFQAGKERERRKAAQDAAQRRRDADEAGADESRKTDGLSDDDIRDRLRNRTSDWK